MSLAQAESVRLHTKKNIELFSPHQKKNFNGIPVLEFLSSSLISTSNVPVKSER